MDKWIEYLVFEAGLSAALPVMLVYLAAYLMVKQIRFHDVVGDGQFCLYATTLSVLTISDLLSAPSVPDGGPAPLGTTVWPVMTMAFVLFVAVFVWAVAVAGNLHAPLVSKKRVAFISLATALAALILGGFFRASAGIL